MAKSKKVQSKSSKIVQTIIYIFLSLLAVLYLLPLAWVLYVSLKDDKTLFVSPWALPERPMIEFKVAWPSLPAVHANV